jgi:Immunity protein 31
MASRAKFSFYEVVSVEPEDRARPGAVKKIGVILGISEDEEQDSDIYYAVLDVQSELTEMIPEVRLVATGQKLRREDFYDGAVLNVKVDPKTGRGWVSAPPEKLDGITD